MNSDPKELLQKYEPKMGQTLEPDRQVMMIRYSPCGKLLAAASCDAVIRRWDVDGDTYTERPALTGHSGWVSRLTFLPDEKTLISADTWGNLIAWNYAEAEPKPLWKREAAHDGWIRDLAISADGKQIATCGFDEVIRIWTPEGEKVHELTGHDDDVFSLAFHPSGEALVSGDLHGRVIEWNTTTGKQQRTLDASELYVESRLQDVGGVRRLVFDPEGQTLACAGTKPKNGGNVQGVPTVLLFDWAAGTVTHTLSVGATGDAFVYEVDFHPAGFVIGITSGNPGTGKFFFHRPGDEEPFFLSTKMRNCHSMAIHPDGRHLIVSATNTGSNGNGRRLKDGEYVGNYSPLHLWELPEA